MSLFTEITQNSGYHNSENYEAFDKITDHLCKGWDFCTDKEEYPDTEFLYDIIPMSFVMEWCATWDAEADGLQWAVDIICA